MKKNNLLTTLVVAVIVGALSFYGGVTYQKSKQPSFTRGQFMSDSNRTGNQNPRTAGGAQYGRPINGQITSLDNTTLTVKSQDGSSKTVIFSDSTVVNQTQTASVSDLAIGDQVMVIGQQDTSGTVTAQTISIGGGFSQFQGQQPPQDTGDQPQQ